MIPLIVCGWSLSGGYYAWPPPHMVWVGSTSKPCTFSVYHKRFHGQRTANGSRYDHYKGYSVAVPPWHRNLLGKDLILSIKTKTGSRIIYARANDICPTAGRFDLSGKAWSDLVRKAPGLAKGTWRVAFDSKRSSARMTFALNSPRDQEGAARKAPISSIASLRLLSYDFVALRYDYESYKEVQP